MRKKTKLKILSSTLLLMIIVVGILYVALDNIVIGEISLPKVRPAKLYLYLYIHNVLVRINVKQTNRIEKIKVNLLVYRYNTSNLVLNKTILLVDAIEGFHDISKEYAFPIPYNLTQPYALYLVDNYTKVKVPVGIPAMFNAALFTTFVPSVPCAVNLSYAVAGKGIIVESSGDRKMSLSISITEATLINRTYDIDVEGRGTKRIDTDYYVKLRYHAYMYNSIVKMFVDKNGKVYFRSQDNALLYLLAITILAVPFIYSMGLIYRLSKQGSGTRRRRK